MCHPSPKILIVEDRQFYHELWSRSLGDKVLILGAYTIEEAEALFAANPELALIVMDACVPGDWPTTLPLVRKIRETFSGPMIAVSSESAYRRKLMERGCDHESDKDDLPQKILEILGL